MLERNRSKWLICVNQEAVKKEFLFKGYEPKRKQKLRKLKKSAQLRSKGKEEPEMAHATL